MSIRRLDVLLYCKAICPFAGSHDISARRRHISIFPLTQLVSGVAQYRLGGNQGQALMIPNGSACVVVTLAGMTQRG